VSAGLMNPGMVMTASWSDLNHDHFPELLIAGDWMPVMLFDNQQGILKDISPKAGLSKTDGMWSSIVADDIDNDGDTDFIIGNCGINNQFRASQSEPMVLYAMDFDNNGTIDPIMCSYVQGKSYPVASRDELLDQIVSLRKKFVKYKDYADATIETIFSEDQVRTAKKFYCYQLNTSVLVNNGNDSFSIRPLPSEAQFSKVYAICIKDFDKDGKKDVLLAGNFFENRVQFGRYDAGMGVLLKGRGDMSFKAISHNQSGLFLDGEVRNAVILQNKNKRLLIILARNDNDVEVLTENE
jgi:hypothetical protein